MRQDRVPRYFFDLTDGDLLRIDTEGVDLTASEAAAREAVRSLLAYALRGPVSASGREIVVFARNDAGRSLYTVRLTVEDCWVE